MAIITISRGSFAGGKAVAEQLAKRLEYPLLGREDILAQAAQDYGISEGDLSEALDQPPAFWQEVLGKRLAYVRCLTAVLIDRAASGNLIYHGIVGHLLLKGVSHLLRVRIIADMETRVESAMKQGGRTRDDALAYIGRVDKQRARWSRVLYGVEWDDPQQYDLIINVGRMPPDLAADLIARAAQAPAMQPTPEGVRAFENQRLSSRVWAALARDPQTRKANLQVVADDGQITVTGNVGSSKAEQIITEVAGQVEGVRKVRCDVGMGSDWYW